MKNRTDYQPGEKVYTAPRKLEARHVAIMTVTEHEVVKRTPTGYKVVQHSAHRGAYLLKDENYYVSTDETEVIEALRCDLADNITAAEVQLEKMRHRDRVLSDLWYGGDGNVD